jgi:hypothetical protein
VIPKVETEQAAPPLDADYAANILDKLSASTKPLESLLKIGSDAIHQPDTKSKARGDILLALVMSKCQAWYPQTYQQLVAYQFSVLARATSYLSAYHLREAEQMVGLIPQATGPVAAIRQSIIHEIARRWAAEQEKLDASVSGLTSRSTHESAPTTAP